MNPVLSTSGWCCAVLATLVVAACSGAPALDVARLVATSDARAAHRTLVLRAQTDPRNVEVLCALAGLAEQLGRPGEAIEALLAVERIGGPFGTRWRDDDRVRLARLLVQRGYQRLLRRSKHAIDDLIRARELGAVVADADIAAARAARALASLRHVDAAERARGREALASLAVERGTNGVDSCWIGARKDASPTERAAFGVWAWKNGARREAYEQLAAWRKATHSPGQNAYEPYYQCARAWWVPPSDREADRAGCAVESEAQPAETAHDRPVSITLAPPGCAALPGECGGRSIAAYTGPDPRADAAARFARARAIAIVDGSGSRITPPLAAAGVVDLSELTAISRAFRWSPLHAVSRSRDLVARSLDAALARATVGALFSALGDPARARAEWETAVAVSDEPAIVAGFAESCARVGDGDAALVAATGAAAAWGDPAVVWNVVGRALLDGNRVVEALTAGRSAIDLAGPETIASAFDIAIEASSRLGRLAQVAALTARRARLALSSPDDQDPAGVASASDTYVSGNSDTAKNVEQAWMKTRRAQREVELRIELLSALGEGDPRRGVIVAELIDLAGDRDSARGLHAAMSLR